MASPAFLSQPTIQRIPPLLEEVRLRQIVVPRFQRPFVWSDEQRLELMRSINEGLPIGSLMVWRTSTALETYRFPGSEPDRSAGSADPPVRQYLLDGHQRVTTLFFALAPWGDESSEANEDEIDEDYPTLREIFFDLRREELELERKGEAPAYWLPVALLFDPYNLFAFQRKLEDLEGARDLLSRAERLVTRFKDYAIPVLPIATDSLDTATKSFQRINSAGTTMSEVHMVNALTYAKDLRIIDRISRIKDSLEDDRWSNIDDQVILNICKARLGIELHTKTTEPLVARITKSPEIFDEVERALSTACRFLSDECMILSPYTLPYSYQIVIIASVLEDVDEQHLESAKNDLYNWFWSTTYTEYFAGTNSTRLRLTMESLGKAVRGEADLLPDDLVREIDPPGRFDFRSARSRAIALGLADRGPCDTEGEPYDGYELLALHGRSACPKLLRRTGLPRALTEGFENRFIAAPGDANDLRSYLLSPDCDPDVAKSHGIDRRAADLIERQDWENFLAHRRETYLAEEQRFAGELGLDYKGA
ncbi:MAG: DUF262 domain-containing protein [Myxococcota bacterium]